MSIENNKLALSNLEDAGIDNAEVFLDSFLKDGVFKEVPVLKTIIAFGKTILSVKDYLLMNKIYIFMKNTEDISREEKDKFLRKINDTKKINEIGMKIIQILDRIDEAKKAALIGGLYKLLIEGEIDTSKYFRICHLIDKCYYDDILQLRYFNEDKSITSQNPEIDTETLEELFSGGLISSHGFDGGTFGGDTSGTIYKLNSYGEIVIKLIQ